MSAQRAMRDEPALASRAEALAIFAVAQRMTDVHLRRLTRLEHGLCMLLDRIDETRASVQRGQALQVEALKLFAQLRGCP